MAKKINYDKIYTQINLAKARLEKNTTYDFGRQVDYNRVVNIFKDLQSKNYNVTFNHKNRGVQLLIEF